MPHNELESIGLTKEYYHILFIPFFDISVLGPNPPRNREQLIELISNAKMVYVPQSATESTNTPSQKASIRLKRSPFSNAKRKSFRPKEAATAMPRNKNLADGMRRKTNNSGRKPVADGNAILRRKLSARNRSK